MICDNDDKFGPRFEQAVKGAGINLIHTPPYAPKANAICERVRREAVWITVQEVQRQTFNEPAVPSAVL